MLIASAVAALLALAAIYVLWSRWALDIVALFCGSVILFYGFRLVVVALGLDPMFPDRLLANASGAAAQTNLLLALFLVAVLVGLAPGSAVSGRVARIFPTSSPEPSLQRLVTASFALTVGSALVTGWLMVRYGGFAATVRAAKLDKELAGTFVLKVVPAVGATVAAISFLEARRRRNGPGGVPRLTRVVLLALTAANAVAVLSWGARSVLVVVGFALLSGMVLFRPPRASVDTPADARSRSNRLLRLGLVAVLVAGMIFGLRIWRDTLLIGEVNQSIRDQAVVRQLSVAANTVQYDAFVLAVRDWPEQFDLRGGEDFVNGALNWVPRVVWENKPVATVPGRWFRQVYEPGKENGWPMGTTGEWYLNFGAIGVIVGGLLSGVALGVARRAYRDTHQNVYSFVCSVIVAFLVIDGGWNSQTPTSWLSWCLPLILVGTWVRGRRRSDTAPADATATGTVAVQP